MASQTLPIRAFVMGFVCGMRSMLGPALVRPVVAKKAQKRSFLQSAADSPVAAALAPVLAAGEFVGDKLPNTPNRTEIGSVIFRSASGAGVGGSLYASEDAPIVAGAVLGVLGALAGTYGCFYIRRELGRRTGLPNLALGLIEDAAALALGLAVTHSKS